MYQGSYNRGLGFEETFSDAISQGPGALLLEAGTSLTKDWDWHEWALAGIGGYLVIRSIFRVGKRGSQAVGKRAKKVSGGFHRRRKALKKVFTG